MISKYYRGEPTMRYERSGLTYEQRYKDIADAYWKLSTTEQTEEEQNYQNLVSEMKIAAEQYSTEINKYAEEYEMLLEENKRLEEDYRWTLYALDVEQKLKDLRNKI